MSFEYKSRYIIVIPTGNKKEKLEVGEMGMKLFTPLLPSHTLSSCVYSDCHYFIH